MNKSGYRKGDIVNRTRGGKVFISQYKSLDAHASLTRTLGDDPEADLAEMDALLERAYHDALLKNFRLMNDCYGAMKSPDDVDGLLDYLEERVRGNAQTKAEVTGATKTTNRKLKRAGS